MKRSNVLSISLMLIMINMTTIGISQAGNDDKTKVQALTKEFAKNMREGNMEKILSMYTTDAISMPSYEPMQDGIAAIRAASQKSAGMGMKYNSFELTPVKITVNGNLIHEIGTYKVNFSMPGMDKPMDDHGKYLTIWEKQKDGSLKVKIETWNSDVDPMASMSQMSQKGMEK
jgi:ketosteroid isomerase-like protein